MRISDAFPSKYLKASDLNGRELKVTIDRVEWEEIAGEQKPVIYFRELTKGLPLNKTNALTIADAGGDEMDNWPGLQLILYPTPYEYQGKSGHTIRVKMPPQKRGGTATPGVNSSRPPGDNVPF